MAVLKFEDGKALTNLEKINGELKKLNISLKLWPTADAAKALLAKDVLSDQEKEELLQHHDHYFDSLKESDGYQTRDLVALHPNVPNLSDLLAKFDKAHTHDDDEVRYIVDGEGVFGFTLPDGQQLALVVSAGDYINVPKDTEHWFYLTESRRIKAVRYFTNMDGWAPVYTGTETRI